MFQTGNDFGNGSGNHSKFAPQVTNYLANDGSLRLQAGDQGLWGMSIYYDAITYTGNVIDSLYSFSGNQGFLNNGLAPWGGATAATRSTRGLVTAFTIPSLRATGAMQAFQTGTRRDILGGDFKYIYGDWTFAGAIRHEHKEGTMEEAFDGPYGGTAFALPIDYDTDRYDASATYNTRAFQGIFQYTFSHFVDNMTFVAMPYPTSNTAAPFQRSAAYSTPPSNDAHYLTMMLASNNLIPLTRVNLNARVGLELQNDQFAPNTADPSLTPAVPGFSALNSNLQGTSANSPDMMAEIYQLKISASSHPLHNVDTHVFYGLDGRSVSLNQYQVNVGGTGGASNSSLSGLAIVVPQDWLKENAGGDIGYRLIPEYNTKVTLGYRFDKVDRSNAQVGHSATNTGSIALTSEIGPNVDSKLSFEFSDRTGSINYLGPWAFLGQSAAYSGAYYQAPMTSEAVILRTDYTPSPIISGGTLPAVQERKLQLLVRDPGKWWHHRNTSPHRCRPRRQAGLHPHARPRPELPAHQGLGHSSVLYIRTALLQQPRKRRLFYSRIRCHSGLCRDSRQLPEPVHQRRPDHRPQRRLADQREAPAACRIHCLFRIRHVRAIQWRVCAETDSVLSERNQLPRYQLADE